MTEKLNIRVRHKEAMENAQQALIAKEKGDNILASKLYFKAFEIEKDVALSLENDIENEPTRSVIFRSAASFANICGLYQDAQKLINLGLSGNPPKDIEYELKMLLKEATKKAKNIYIDVPLNKDKKKLSILPEKKSKLNSANKRFPRPKSGLSTLKQFSIKIIKKVLPSSAVSHPRRSHVSH